MDEFDDIAQALAAYLRRVVGLESISWVVDWDKEMESELPKATKKKLGLGTIRFTAGENPDPKSQRLAFKSDFNLSLAVKPSIRRGKPEGRKLARLVAAAIHGWWPEETPTKDQVKFQVRKLIQAPKVVEGFQVFLLTAQCTVRLAPTTIELNPP